MPSDAGDRDDPSADPYAPPREDQPPPRSEPTPGGNHSPVLVGFLTLLCTATVSSAAAAGLMSIWAETTPKGGEFLASLGVAIMAGLSWMCLTAHAVLAGITLAVGMLRDGVLSEGQKLFVALLSLGAAVPCFLPEPSIPQAYLSRGGLGIVSEAVTLIVTGYALRFARRRFVAPPTL